MTIAERPLVERPPEAGSTRADAIDRSNDIDLYRGLAALLVAAMHTRMITWIGIREFWRLHGLELTPEALLAYATLPLAFGSIGVPIFFVLSGYCIHRLHAARRARLGSFGLSPVEFYARRFFRIYPVLLGALALTSACDTASRGLVPESPLIGDTGVRAFLVNLLSLQGVAGGTYGSNIALWTLAIEVQLYLFYPLLAASMARVGNGATFLWLSALAALSYYAFERHGFRWFASYWPSWFLGALIAEADASGAASKLSPFARRIWLGAGLALLGVGGMLLSRSEHVAFHIWALAFASLLYARSRDAAESLGGVAAALLRWLGSFSFSIYIVHLPIVVLIHSICFSGERQAGIAPFAAILLAAIGCAYVFHRLCERPALALSRKIKREGLGALYRAKYFSMMRR